GDRLFVSAEVAAYLDRLRELGVSRRTVRLERGLLILLQSASPREAALLIAHKRDALGDPEFRALYLPYDTAFDWSPDDSRLDALADRAQRWIANRRGKSERKERLTQTRPSPGWSRRRAARRRRPGIGSPRSPKSEWRNNEVRDAPHTA